MLSFSLLAAGRAGADPWSLSVVDENGVPVQTTVRISNFGQEPQHFDTDAAGHLHGDLPPQWGDSLGFVFIHVPGHAPAVGSLRPGANKAVLGAPHQLSGRLLDDSGAPLPGVAVSVNYFMDYRATEHTLADSVEGFLYSEEIPLFQTRTDADGRYTLHDLPGQGSVSVVVNDPNWQNVKQPVQLEAGIPVPDLRTRPAARLQGRLLGLDGAPVTNVHIYAQGEGGDGEAITDANGRYLLGGLPAGKIKIEPFIDPLTSPGVAPPAETLAVAGTVTSVPDIRLIPGAVLEVLTNLAMAGAQLDLRSDELPDNVSGFDFESALAPVHVRVVPGKYHLAVSHPPKGFIAAHDTPKGGLAIDATEGKTIKETIGLDPALVLHGIARDGGGKPVAGARLGIGFAGFDAQMATTGADELSGIAMSMIAVNTQRALEMTNLIPPTMRPDGSEDYSWRYEAQRKVAQYLLTPADVRRTFDFARWNASDTWTPGDDSGW